MLKLTQSQLLEWLNKYIPFVLICIFTSIALEALAIFAISYWYYLVIFAWEYVIADYVFDKFEGLMERQKGRKKYPSLYEKPIRFIIFMLIVFLSGDASQIFDILGSTALVSPEIKVTFAIFTFATPPLLCLYFFRSERKKAREAQVEKIPFEKKMV